MGFPWAFHENFEGGTKGGFDPESDVGNRLSYPGPQQLARDQMAVYPHRGGYCMRVNLGKNTTDAYAPKAVTWAADATNFLRFEFLIGDDVQIGNDGDLVDIMVLRSASVDEGAICLARVEPAGMVIGLRDTAGAVEHYLSVQPGDWMCLEAQIDVDAGAGNDGSIVLWHGNDKIKLGALDQAAMAGLRFGAINQTGDFTGHIYFDEVLVDEARLFQDYGPHNLRLDGETMPMFKSGFAFVGDGTVLGCQLIAGTGTDAVLKVYDTDDVSYAEHVKKEHLTAVVAGTVAYSQPLGDGQYLFKVRKGAYVELVGAGNPHALIRLGMVDELRVDADAEDYGEEGYEEPGWEEEEAA